MEQLKKFRQLALLGFLGATAVALGALGAHALKNKMSTGLITADQLNGFDTGVKYHMYHTLAMLGVLLLQHNYNSRFLRYAWWFFLWGIIIFSGSLYLLCTRGLTGMEFLRMLGPVTPLGGILLVCGWVSLCVPAFNKQ